MTLQQQYESLASAHPVLTARRNGADVVLSEGEREATLQRWAAARHAAMQPKVKSWPNAQMFMNEFSMDERAAIGLCQKPEIAALLVTLQTWQSSVVSDHPLVLAGRVALVAAGLITTERANQIFGTLPAS